MRPIFVLAALMAVAFANVPPAVNPQKFFGTELPHCYKFFFWSSRLCLTWENDVSALCSGNVNPEKPASIGISGSSSLPTESGQSSPGSSSEQAESGQTSKGGSNSGTGSSLSSLLSRRA
ncbi:uncharacterized protein LOC144118612 [Amblyomma americanum]